MKEYSSKLVKDCFEHDLRVYLCTKENLAKIKHWTT